eukprot:scaffold346_cov116-Cylindrotheca_fusiformis.AAC.26
MDDTLSTSLKPFSNMIASASLRDPSPDNGAVETPSKSRVTAVGNEENQENMIQPCQANLSTPSKQDYSVDAPMSVSARREWLREFGEKSSNHYRSGGNNKTMNSETNKSSSVSGIAKARISMTSSAPAAPSSVPSANKVRMPVSSPALAGASSLPSASKVGVPTGSAAPCRVHRQSIAEPVKRNFTPRKKKTTEQNGVEATDDSVASVAKLSQWLASDPTAAKKTAASVRKGRQVSYKARNFERGQESIIVKENHIQRGSVSVKKNWLKQAFHATVEEVQVDELTSRLNRQYAKSEIGVYDPSASRSSRSEIITSRPSNMSVAAKKDWLKKAFKSAADASREAQKPVEEPRSVIITDDAASSLSVSDKKKLLQGAFRKPEGTLSTKPLSAQRFSGAASDIMHCRGESRDEIASRAKRRFLQRSAQTGSSGCVGTPNKNTPVKPSPLKRTPTKKRTGFDPMTFNPQTEGRFDGACKLRKTDDAAVSTVGNSGSLAEPKKTIQVEEDKTPVDFRAARDLLVQRGRKNGNNVELQNKRNFKMPKCEETEFEGKHTTNDISKEVYEC